jgi:dihydroneopterin aldolase
MATARVKAMKDTIYIRDLRVETIIGIFGWEREVRQQISMDLDFEFDVSVPGKSDSIDDTLDYKKITKSLIAFIESSDYKLIEALGEGIVDHLKSKFGIKKVKLRLSKPGALRFSKDVGIMIER